MTISFFAFLCGFLVLTAVVAAEIEDILSAVISLSVFGILLAIAFAILQAPDVALTQAVINSGLVTSLFLVAYSQTEKQDLFKKGDH
ncbi:MAG: Na(+)/H(+) antiporter subunit B [Thermovirgaceae bacterium]